MFRTSFHDGPGLQQRRGRAALHTSARFRPQVEALEDRTVASSTTLTVTPNPAPPGQPVTLVAAATGVGGILEVTPDGRARLRVVVRFEFYADGTLLAQRSQDSFAFDSRTTTVSDQFAVSLPTGTHTLVVKLVNLVIPDGSSTSAPVSLVVAHPPHPP